jgi:dipeptidyl aminopeptidase/acylaminoacyl peptidase
VLVDAGWDVEQVDVSPDGSTVAFTTNEDGISRLHLLDTATGQHRAVEGIPSGVISFLDWRDDGSEIGFSLQSAATPLDVYSLMLATREITRWTRGELGGLEYARLAEPERIRWTAFDGRHISGLLYRPPPSFTGSRPVIIDIHGGPESQERATYLGRYNYFLNELGASIVFPNVRGSTGYGKTFASLDNGLRRLDSVRDIGALLDWIATQPDLDAGRVMVMGGSYGGYMTLAVASMYPERIRAALDIVGISHMGTFLRNTESYRRDLRRVEYGDERDSTMAAFFEESAPLTNAGRITRPLFVIQGANDPRVPRSEAEQIVARVRENGSPVWYLLAMNEGHGFARKENTDYQFYATIMFVREYLLGE